MTSQRQPAEDSTAHHRPHALGGLVRQHRRGRQSYPLHEHVRRHDARERETEDGDARRVRGQVSTEVGRVAGPRDRQTQRHGDLEDERPDQISAVSVGGRHDLVAADEFDGEHNERDEQDDGKHGLQPVDDFVAEEADDALDSQHDQYGDPERNAEKDGERVGAEQAHQAVPCDRRQPLQRRRQDHAAAEGHPRVGQLARAGPRTPGRQVTDHQ